MPRKTRQQTTPRKDASQHNKISVKQETSSSSTSPSSSNEETSKMPSFPTPSLTSHTLRTSYAIARGEQGVLTFEPYKSILLPHWRFRTFPIAQESSQTLKTAFDFYVLSQDFVGADMARKFIQMGMTRARRYANHKGGKKYNISERELEKGGGERKVLPKSEGHAGMEEKAAASEAFKVVWRECIEDQAYLKLKEGWKREKADWEKNGKKVEDDNGDTEEEEGIKEEVRIKKEEEA